MKEKKKMNTYLKYGLMLAVCVLVGGVLGFWIAAAEGSLLSLQAGVSCMVRTVSTYLLPELLVLLLLEVIYGEYALRKSKKAAVLAAEAEDEEGDHLDYELERTGAWGTGIMTSAAFLAMVLMSTGYSMAYIETLTKKGEILALLGAFVVFIGIYVYNGYWGIRLVKIQQKLNPAKKGDPASMRFTEEWVESCDEAEKALIYQSSFKSWVTLSKWVSVLMLAAMLAHLIWNTGILAVVLTGLTWLLLNVSYVKNCVKKRAQKLLR